MKRRKWLIALVAVLVVLLGAWIALNPLGKFGMSTFACVTYNSLPRPIADFQVRSDGQTRKVEKTHDLTLQHINWLLADEPDVLIVAIGWDGITQPRQEILDLQTCDLHVLTTDEAIALYNDLKKAGRRVAIHVHTTC